MLALVIGALFNGTPPRVLGSGRLQLPGPLGAVVAFALSHGLVLLQGAVAATGAAGAAEVGQIFQRYCLDCHEAAAKQGGLTLEGMAKYADAPPTVWAAVRKKFNSAKCRQRRRRNHRTRRNGCW